MTGKLTRDAYRRLIEEDLEWLMQQPPTLERSHIARIVRASERYEYGPEKDSGPGVAGDRCQTHSECGRTGCPNCQD